jgi:hypothetical protein
MNNIEEQLKSAQAEIRNYKRFCLQGANVIDGLRLRLLNRKADDMDQMPADRAALLDADLWLSEAYRVNIVNK